METSPQLSDETPTGHNCLESHMETSAQSSDKTPQMSDETPTGYDCLESRMETSAQSSDKPPIPL